MVRRSRRSDNALDVFSIPDNITVLIRPRIDESVSKTNRYIGTNYCITRIKPAGPDQPVPCDSPLLSSARVCVYACLRACGSNKNSFNRTRAGLLFPLRRGGNDSREDVVVAPSANKRNGSESTAATSCFIIHRFKDRE